MESRDIFNRNRKTIEWESNWVHIGTVNQIDIVLIEKYILELFDDQENVMLRRGRRDSKPIQTSKAVSNIIELIGFENFELWDEEFCKAIKFNRIGVMMKSKYAI